MNCRQRKKLNSGMFRLKFCMFHLLGVIYLISDLAQDSSFIQKRMKPPLFCISRDYYRTANTSASTWKL
ncbi:uncharacterized protein BDW43DRAFT_281478 [Aspergillus alliaceus]|uniref:uncharacterized protein n=1 Tax=Petromyces alliaceus TaxID=209559 RepID=UPI0012A48D05|nr:uncharacterized protein BDW43DRAFT_281478 [Aspergillus alliaceus]KAB8231732.1 hypothetical protein BDW43DRAFT_281478 [Aspergillus alliaceus]